MKKCAGIYDGAAFILFRKFPGQIKLNEKKKTLVDKQRCQHENMGRLMRKGTQRPHPQRGKNRDQFFKPWRVVNMHVNACHKKCRDFVMPQNFFKRFSMLVSSLNLP